MTKRMALALLFLVSASYASNDTTHQGYVYDEEAQQTDDLGTQAHIKTTKLLKELADMVRTQKEEISNLKKRVTELESYIKK